MGNTQYKIVPKRVDIYLASETNTETIKLIEDQNMSFYNGSIQQDSSKITSSSSSEINAQPQHAVKQRSTLANN